MFFPNLLQKPESWVVTEEPQKSLEAGNKLQSLF